MDEDFCPVTSAGLLGPAADSWTTFCRLWGSVGLLAFAGQSSTDGFADLLGVSRR